MITFIKKLLKNKWVRMLFIILSYLSIDIAFRYFVIKNEYYYSIRNIAPIFFDLAIIAFNMLIIKLLPKVLSIIYYIISSVFLLIMGIVQYFHFKILGTCFTFSELFLAGEGLDFISSVESYINWKILFVIITIIILIIMTIILLILEEKNKIELKKVFIYIIAVVLFETLGIVSLNIFKESYSETNSPYYNFKTYTASHKSIQVTGLLQYNVQDIFMHYYNAYMDEKNKELYIEELNVEMSKNGIYEENDYTNTFKDKNLIYVMLEGIDDWLITEETTPTLYKMQNEGWNFTNRYAPHFYSGYTFGTEFAANTGLYLMESYDKYIDNSFPYALPNLFKNEGYKVNSYHMNMPEFYNRDKYHKSFGYEEYIGGYYVSGEYEDYTYINDADWINNKETYDLLVDKDEKFMSFLITYSGHMPYSKRNLQAHYNFKEDITFNNSLEEQLFCIKYQAQMTDKMFELLLKRLKEDKLLDDTVIVVFTDHYAYGFTDKNYLKEQKGVSEDILLQKAPLIIWSKDIKHKEIDTIMDTADLVPTVANLFGIKYDPTKYLSTDVFSKNHDEFVYFNNGTYVDNKKKLHQNTDEINTIIKYNKNILKTDYYTKGK